MLRLLLLSMMILSACPGFSGNPSVSISPGLSKVSYREEVKLFAAKSDWQASAWILAAEVTVEEGAGLFLAAEYQVSEQAKETWRKKSGSLLQTNQLQSDRIRVSAGWRSGEQPIGSGDFRWRMYGFAGNHEFTRSGFLLNTSDGQSAFPGGVTETVHLFGLGVGLRSEWPLGTGWFAGVDARAEWIVWDEAENSGFNATLSGSGGRAVYGGLGLIRGGRAERHQLGLWLRAGFRELDGGTGQSDGQVLEWPENRWEDVQLALEWRISW